MKNGPRPRPQATPTVFLPSHDPDSAARLRETATL